MAAVEASFSTSIDSMSAGLRSERGVRTLTTNALLREILINNRHTVNHIEWAVVGGDRSTTTDAYVDRTTRSTRVLYNRYTGSTTTQGRLNTNAGFGRDVITTNRGDGSGDVLTTLWSVTNDDYILQADHVRRHNSIDYICWRRSPIRESCSQCS